MKQIHERVLSECPIAAIATALGPGGVSVVRVSGSGALAVGDRLIAAPGPMPSERPGGTFFYAKILHPVTRAVIDDAVVLVYRPPHSYTGEETLEIQGHGGTLPSRRVLEAVLEAGARLAEPGEFTKRAFLNGRLDLTQAEAVCDFIQSKTERAACAARAQLDGVLGRRVNGLYEEATLLCAEVERMLDVDDGDLPEGFIFQLRTRLRAVRNTVETLRASWSRGHLLRDGALVVISGRPNAGKSSLMNVLLGHDRAIVTDTPGTTRDLIEEMIDLGGIPVRLMDTAGLRRTEDAIEREGIERARSAMRRATLNLHLVDRSVPWTEESACEVRALDPARTLVAWTKSDLPAAAFPPPADLMDRATVTLSARTGEGLDTLRTALLAALDGAQETPDEPVVSLRQAEELQTAAEAFGEADIALEGGGEALVIAANRMRAGAEALARMVGRVYSDDLLDTLFSRFCVGK